MKEICKIIRGKILDAIYNSKASHIGSSMSVVEILTAVYESIDCKKILNRDKFRSRVFVSKGHAAAATYATMN